VLLLLLLLLLLLVLLLPVLKLRASNASLEKAARL
jgi:hypothetical protein